MDNDTLDMKRMVNRTTMDRMPSNSRNTTDCSTLLKIRMRANNMTDNSN